LSTPHADNGYGRPVHPDRRRTLAAAAHPIVLGAAALIWINDRVLAGKAPGWLTACST